ncbi:putative c-3 sterol dehydrogenase c-4 decarboxylase [Phaeomoniella chlamydospora]|uniref:Putative c-3 sterol dehydrogenase c-4 decarboxylase n=1 Tax=Phaeomoniella chlamydospora TaxID=158046 RepID=A0A0G2GXW3_PHACM|nr:putative c-3 sterol dehydrogenase c-4 decarboxylase [Phaeomoniella chlamydospora]
MVSQRQISLGRVLVVGGCGMLGSHFVEQLLNFPNENTQSAANGVSDSTQTSKLLRSRTGRSTLPHSSEFQYPSSKSRYPKYVNTEVHVLDLRCVKNRYEGATYHEADITSADALLAIFQKVKPDVIFHTASPVFDSPKPILYKVNVGGTRTLLEVAGGEHGDWGGVCKAFVYTSSSSVIHDNQTDLVNADERYPVIRPNLVEYYSETKGEADELVLQSNNKFQGMLTCSLRPAGIIGERDVQYSYKVLQHAIAAPSWQLRMQLGDNENLFDLTYAGNIALAHFLAAERLLMTHKRVAEGGIPPLSHEKVDGEAFMITNDNTVTFWDATFFLWSLLGKVVEPSQVIALNEGFAMPLGMLAQAVTTMMGRESKFTPQTVRFSCMRRYFNCSKAKQRLGYRPLIGLEEALIRSCKSFLEQEEAKVPAATKKEQ